MKMALRILLVLWIVFPALGQTSRFFPQVGDGITGPLGIRTSIILANTGIDSEAKLDFFDSEGQALALEFGAPYGKTASFTVPLPAGKTAFLETKGTAPLQVGYARMTAPAEVGGTAVFTGFDTSTQTILFEAGVPASQPVQSFTVVLDSMSTRDTGLALVAPPDQAAASASLSIVLYDEQFSRKASRNITIPKGQKLSKYIWEYLEIGGGTPVPAAKEMRGSVSVFSDVPLAAVTLRQMFTPAFPVAVPTLTTFPVVPGTAYPADGEWTLVWSDEFDGTSIDKNKWGYEIGAGGWGNNELEYYTDSPYNSFIENGKLVIQALTDLTRRYTSARMLTRTRGDWKYGKVEVRAKLPQGKGIWPAIWMMPTDSVYGGWAASGEIDIMEFLGHELNKVYGTIHFGGPWPLQRSSGGHYVLQSGNFSDSFHTFTLEWEPTEMRWYVDQQKYLTKNEWDSNSANPPAPFPAPFNQRFYLILNVAVGGNWPGNPDSTTVFPQRLEVEYVRVYQRH